jgi:hypothetical protein
MNGREEVFSCVEWDVSAVSARAGLSLVCALCLGLTSFQAESAAACVIAKKQGNSQAIEWVAQPGVSVAAAVAEAKRRLGEQGFGQGRYEGLFPQANSPLDHAHVIIVRTEYTNARGKKRVSYGCGFSEVSEHEAEWDALRDLQSYSWGWVPSKGYDVVERFRY